MANRVAVKVREIPVPATSHPEINIYFDGSDEFPSQSSITWEHPDFMAGLRQMFGVQKDEVVSHITIDEKGIKASFRKRK